jgi:hypothetical protein
MTSRVLTAPELSAVTQRLRAESADPMKLDRMLRELALARSVLAVVNSQRRCLPRHAREALDMVRPRPTAVEYFHD